MGTLHLLARINQGVGKCPLCTACYVAKPVRHAQSRGNQHECPQNSLHGHTLLAFVLMHIIFYFYSIGLQALQGLCFTRGNHPRHLQHCGKLVVAKVSKPHSDCFQLFLRTWKPYNTLEYCLQLTGHFVDYPVDC